MFKVFENILVDLDWIKQYLANDTEVFSKEIRNVENGILHKMNAFGVCIVKPSTK